MLRSRIAGEGHVSLFGPKVCATFRRNFAGIAQLVEQLICNQQVVGSNPTAGLPVSERIADARIY